MNIAITDDNEAQRANIKKICLEFAEVNRIKLECDCYVCGEDFIAALPEKKYDIVFMDVFMSGKTGVETAKKLRTFDRDCLLIFLTSSTDFMPDAFSCHAYEYITKPYTDERIFSVLKDAVSALPQEGKYIELVSERRTVSVSLSDIVSAVTDGHYINVWLSDDRCIRCRLTVNEFLSIAENDSRFVVINKGIIINVDFLESVTDNCCVLSNDYSYPIKIRNRVEIERMLLRHCAV